MGHVYEVHTTGGDVHHIETDHHHENHDDATFARHRLEVVKSAVGGVVSGSVLRFIYRGRR